MPIQLNIPTQIGLKENVKANLSIVELGDSYMQVTTGDVETSFDITSGFLDRQSRNYLDAKLREFNGVLDFFWQPSVDFPIGLYRCSKWMWSQVSPRTFILNATFETSDQVDYVNVENEINTTQIDSHLTQAWNFIKRYTRDSNLPALVNANKLPLTNWHIDGTKHGKSTGDSTTCFTLTRALLNFYDVNKNPETLQYAIDIVNSAINTLYRGVQVPTNINEFWLPHRLYVAERSIETELSVTNPNYLQSGHFVQLTSSNGIFTTFTDLARVFTGGGEAVWKNLNSPLLNSQPLQFGYWIDKYNRKVSIDGTFTVNNTPYPPGTIVTSPLEPGTFRFAITRYSGTVIQKNNVIENYPLWRGCFANEFNFDFATALPLLQTYELLAKLTSDSKWQRAYNATKNSINSITTPAHRNYILKSDVRAEIESLPGVKVLKINRQGTFEIASNGAISINQNAKPNSTLPSQLELCNAVVSTQWTAQTNLFIKFACSIPTIFYVALAINSNIYDSVQDYNATYYVESGIYESNFKLKSFVKWDAVTWYASANESYMFTSGSATTSLTNSNHQDAKFVSVRLLLPNNAASGRLNLTGISVKLPAKIFYKSTGDIQIYIIDGSDHLHVCFNLPPVDVWTEWSFDFNTLSSEYVPDYFNPLKEIKFKTTTSAILDIYFLGNSPTVLPINSQVYTHKIVNKQSLACAWSVSDYEVTDSLMDILPYTPGILPQSYNKTDYAKFWQGKPLVSNANESLWIALGFPQYAKTAVQFKKNSQDSYSASNPSKRDYFFKPAFNTVNWDVAVRSPFNAFSESGEINQDLAWHGHTHYAIASTAEFWANNPDDSTAQLVTMRFLTGIFRELNSRRVLGQDVSAPNLYPKSNFDLPPQWIKSTPHGDALVLRSAMYANLAGGDRLITMRVLVDMWNSLKSQFVDYYGDTAGSWTLKQAIIPSPFDGTLNREYQTLWHAEIITSLILLRNNKARLRYPSCNLWVA